jgi:hypothetical protein
MRRTCTWIASGYLFFLPSLASTATQLQVDQAWNKGVAWLMLNQHGDGGWSSTLLDGNTTRQGLGMQATSAAVDALASMGLKGGYTYMGGVAWLGNAEPASVDALARQILGLKASGSNLGAYGTRLTAARNSQNLWGAYARYERSVMDTALGLRAMLDVNAAYAEANENGCALLAAQHKTAPDYGWSHAILVTGMPAGQKSSTIAATAHAVLALKRWAGSVPSMACSTGTYTFSTLFNNAVSWLLTKKNADSGFGDNGTSSVLESALALAMLKAVAPSNAATATTLNYLIAQQAADGSWGMADALQTAETLSALAAASTVTGQRPSDAVAMDTDKDGVPDDAEVILGTNPATTDSRYLADGSGSTVTQPAQLLAAASVAGAPTSSGVVNIASDSGGDALVNSWIKPADVELYLAGTSTQFQVFPKVMERLVEKGGLEILLDDGGVRGSASGSLYRAYYGVITGTADAHLDGKRLLVHFSAQGGTESGVGPVARASAVPRMRVDRDCVETDTGRWSCPAGDRVSSVPDAGVTEAPPDWKTGTTINTLRNTELARLDTQPVNSISYGLAVSDGLRNASLNSLDFPVLARLMAGDIQTWNEADAGLPDKAVVLCRLAQGAQPAVEALVLGQGCNADARRAATATRSSGGLSGLLVVENESTEAVVRCLERADAGGDLVVGGAHVTVPPGSLAAGVITTDRQPASIEHWGFIGMDGVEPGRAAIQSGTYRNASHGWMHWRKTSVSGIAPPSGDKLALLKRIRSLLGDPGVLSDAEGAFPVRDAGGALLPDGICENYR